MKLVIALIALMSVGCATSFYEAKPQAAVTNLSAALSGVTLAVVDGKCLSIINLKSNKQIRSELNKAVCAEASDVIVVEKASKPAEPRP
jgi:hypothetical protein